MFVYIMANQNNTVLYIGVTNHLARRILEHQKDIKKECFTNRYNIHKLVYYEYGTNAEAAINREKYLKKCYRRVKKKLITDFNPTWKDLSYKILG